MKRKLFMATKSIVAIALAGAILAAAPARAQEVKPMFKVGVDTGGDKLVTVLFTDGSTQSINANEGFFLGGGVSIVNLAKDIETEISISYKSGTIKASNGEINWTRYPIDALVFYRFPKVRLGGGLTYHLGPKLSGSGFASPINGSPKDAAGFMLQADYRLAEKMAVGLRYTSLEYKFTGAASAKSDGIGVVFSMSF
jgi:hypothetical protein